MSRGALLRGAALALAALALLWGVYSLYLLRAPLAALVLLVAGAALLWLYGQARGQAWRYLLPGVAAMGLFIALPLAYTVRLGFTNQSSAHLLSEDGARAYLLAQAEFDPDAAWHVQWALHLGALHLRATPPGGGAALGAGPVEAGQPVHLAPASSALPGTVLGLKGVVQQRDSLLPLQLQLPDGRLLAYAGPRQFAELQPLYRAAEGGALQELASGRLYRPDRERGFFVDTAGQALQPGFVVDVGLAHYRRLLGDADLRGPFIAIFVWTVAFAGLTVLLATALGLALASVLEWPALQHRTLYRTLLFLPYAVPGFISILVWKGLFNQNFGEINAILDALFGIRPAWFADPWLARLMILVVNTWLGYPYIMILCSGLLKAIPADLVEASAMAGASPWAHFRRVTLPLVLKPLAPLLVSAFAFNFNNFVLIALLTDGRPDFLNTKVPAGTTDILVSYTYRIAFTDAGQNFGLAAAISTLIFGLVALLSLANLRLSRASQKER